MCASARLLAARGLNQSLFEAVARDLEETGATIRKATIIDATIIGSVTKGDSEAAWAKHRTRSPAHGYKAHIAADGDSGIIREVATTPANEAAVSIALSSSPIGLAGFLATRPIMRPELSAKLGHRH